MKKFCLIPLLFFLSSLFVQASDNFELEATMQAKIKNEKVLICGVCKNVAPFLDKMKQNIESLGKVFKDYKVIVYENNSTDNTKDLLKRWANINSNIKIISEDLTVDQFQNISKARTFNNKPCRMEVIAYARNQVLKEVYRPEYNDYKYLIMTDLDFRTNWNIESITSSFLKTEPWDVISANGVSPNMNYFDKYALRSPEIPFGPEVTGQGFWEKDVPKHLQYSGDALIEVMSAFGGFAIYKIDSIRDLYYSGLADETLKKFYVSILDNPNYQNHWSIKGILDVFKKLKDIPFYNNSGYDLPVCCEHVIFHARLKKRNKNAKIYINPSMLIFY